MESSSYFHSDERQKHKQFTNAVNLGSRGMEHHESWSIELVKVLLSIGLLWSEYLCPPKIPMLNPKAQ